MYILEISDYVGVFIVLVTYIWITSECLFMVYFDETRLCSVLRIFGRKEFVYVGAFCARRYFLKVCAKCILEELDYVGVFSILCKTI